MWNIFKIKIIESVILDSKKITKSKPKVIESIIQYFNKKVTESTILDSIKTPNSITFRHKN